MNMSFTLACVRDYLAIHGFVYTIRAEKYDYPAIVMVEGIGECRAEKLIEVSKEEDLPENIVRQSGFDSRDDWWATALAFKAIPGNVWLVVKKGE